MTEQKTFDINLAVGLKIHHNLDIYEIESIIKSDDKQYEIWLQSETYDVYTFFKTSLENIEKIYKIYRQTKKNKYVKNRYILYRVLHRRIFLTCNDSSVRSCLAQRRQDRIKKYNRANNKNRNYKRNKKR